MNHLAHALLAGTDPDLIIGSLLGDFWHGAPDPRWPPRLRAGVLLHRHCDSYTDAHAQVVAARGLFVAPYRRYAGILLDVYFDHLLARDWPRFSATPLARFSAQLLDLLDTEAARLPENMQQFLRYMRRHRLPGAYAERAMLAQVLAGIGQRLRHANPLAGSEQVLYALAPQLRATFGAFMPDLIAFAQGERARLLGA